MDYRLLKETQIIKAGAIYTPDPDQEGWYHCKDRKYLKFGCDEAVSNKESVENNPEWFEPIPQFKVGDWVVITGIKGNGDYAGNGLEEPENIVKLLKIDESKQPTGNLIFESHFMFQYKDRYFRTSKEWILRYATQAEINFVTKKFPFQSFGLDISEYNAECVELQADKRKVYLNEEAWREIGKRKGWAL